MTSIKKNTGNKLKGEHKAILIQLLADFCGNDEVIEYFKREFNIEMSSGNVSFYRKTHEKDIIQQRESLNKRMLAIPIANKFYRIEQRQKLMDDLFENLWFEDVKMKNNQIVYKANGIAERFKLKGNHNIINNLLDSTQKELEPQKIAPTTPDGNELFTGIIMLPEKDSRD